MGTLLTPGQTLRTESGRAARVVKFLGDGTQGEVYAAECDGGAFALKWYKPEAASPGQLGVLLTLVRKGPPSARFLWPLDLAVNSGPGRFGYLMPLREPRFYDIPSFMRRKVEAPFRARATAGYQLAEAFLALHAKGLCYCDVSFGNLFLDPATGDVAVCDNDNVIVNGETPAILGTKDFMAPEVVRGEAVPNLATDKYSLAVLLFYLFFLDHPLKGRRETQFMCLGDRESTRMYGTDPLYVFDPRDSSNRPVPGLHDAPLAYEHVYPAGLKRLFERSFTDGLRDPHGGRVTESEWRDAMVQLRDSLLYCPGCRADNFYDPEPVPGAGPARTCWRCRKPLVFPFRVRIGSQVVVLNHDTKLYPHHLDPDRRFDFGRPVAEVARHPTDPTVWGLRNMSGGKWTVSTGGSVREIEVGRSVALSNETRVNFGRVEGEIRY